MDFGIGEAAAAKGGTSAAKGGADLLGKGAASALAPTAAAGGGVADVLGPVATGAIENPAAWSGIAGLDAGTAGAAGAGAGATDLAALSAGATPTAAATGADVTALGNVTPDFFGAPGSGNIFTGPGMTAVPDAGIVPQPGPSAPMSFAATGGPGPVAAPMGAAPVDLSSAAATTAPGTAALSSYAPGAVDPLTGLTANTGAVAGAPGAAGPAAAGGGGTLDTLLKWGGPAVAGAGLAMNMMKPTQVPGQAQEKAAAGSLAAEGAVLQNYFNTGTLPPGLDAAAKQAAASARAKAISNAGASGQSADPTQNTALAAELASIDQQAIITAATLGQQMLTSGLSATEMSAQIYGQIASLNWQQAQATSTAIANLAAALSPKPTINIGTRTTP